MAQNLMFEAQQLAGFFYASAYGAYVYPITPMPFSLTAGEEYTVIWGNDESTAKEYNLIATAFVNDGAQCVFVGNQVVIGGALTEEPFAIVCDNTNNFVYFFSTESKTEYWVGVYQTETDEPEEPVGIVLKDYKGNDQIYEGVEKVKFNTSDGGTRLFSKGDTLKRIPIDLDFTEGDQTINAPEGYLVKSAIIRKPDTLKPENIVKDVEVAGVIGISEGGGGGESAERKYDFEYDESHWLDDVCFWDLDGNLVLNVPMSSVPNLESLPTPPEYDGLTFVRWNYTLEQIRAAEYPLDIGALYKPTDGNTHIKINITNTSYKTIILNFQQTIDGGVNIDWGDGSSTQTVSGTGQVSATHAYSNTGKYEIILSVADGCIMSPGTPKNSSDSAFVTTTSSASSVGSRYASEIYFGDGVELVSYSCYYMRGVTRIVLPIDMTYVPDYSFYTCISLLAIIIPDGVTSIGKYAFYNTSVANFLYRQKWFTVCCLPESIESMGDYVLCGSILRRFVVPKNMTSLPSEMFGAQNMLRRLFMPNDKITSVGASLISKAPFLELKYFPSSPSLVTIPNYFIQDNKVTKSYTIPVGVTTIGNSMLYRCNLEEVVIPRSVTTIGSNFLQYALNLKRIIVCGSNITSIGSIGSNGIAESGLEVVFYSETPPTSAIFAKLLVSVSGGLQRVFVPDAAISAYKTMMGSYANTIEIHPISEYRGTLPEPC